MFLFGNFYLYKLVLFKYVFQGEIIEKDTLVLVYADPKDNRYTTPPSSVDVHAL